MVVLGEEGLIMLDDANVLKQRDPQGALSVAAGESNQLLLKADLLGSQIIKREFSNIVVTGMGGSALAADLAKSWLDFDVPFEIVRRYEMPAYVGPRTLVVASSYSGNTEETLSAYNDAVKRGAEVAVLSSDGQLLDLAKKADQPHIVLPAGQQPRMEALSGLKALISLLEAYGLVQDKIAELESASSWLAEETKNWIATSPTSQNLAKKLALDLPGKTPIVYGGVKTGALAHKWKIGFNENAKNLSFSNELPEFNHNEFIGWSSHPVEKAFGVIDLVSSLESRSVLRRFELSDRLLSGMRPKAIRIDLKGESLLKQILWGVTLGDFVSIYLAILNGVNPTPVDLVEKLKAELKDKFNK